MIHKSKQNEEPAIIVSTVNGAENIFNVVGKTRGESEAVSGGPYDTNKTRVRTAFNPYVAERHSKSPLSLGKVKNVPSVVSQVD